MIIPDEAIEAAAEAIYKQQRNHLHGDPAWTEVEEQYRQMYRDEASAALTAALHYIGPVTGKETDE